MHGSSRWFSSSEISRPMRCELHSPKAIRRSREESSPSTFWRCLGSPTSRSHPNGSGRCGSAGLQLTTSLGHLAKAFQSDLLPMAYAAALRFWSYPILIILLFGTWREHRRSAATAKRLGADLIFISDGLRLGAVHAQWGRMARKTLASPAWHAQPPALLGQARRRSGARQSRGGRSCAPGRRAMRPRRCNSPRTLR